MLDKVILSLYIYICLYVLTYEGGRMKKRLNLTIDSDIYDALQELPRKVNISEVVTWVFKILLEDLKKGRELTKEELDDLLKRTAEGKDFQERLREHWGPGIEKIDAKIEKIKSTVKPKRGRK